LAPAVTPAEASYSEQRLRLRGSSIDVGATLTPLDLPANQQQRQPGSSVRGRASGCGTARSHSWWLSGKVPSGAVNEFRGMPQNFIAGDRE
jgi:hypothetical protein